MFVVQKIEQYLAECVKFLRKVVQNVENHILSKMSSFPRSAHLPQVQLPQIVFSTIPFAQIETNARERYLNRFDKMKTRNRKGFLAQLVLPKG